MKVALIILNTLAKEEKLNFNFVANVHDEWQVEVLEEEAPRLGELGVQAMNTRVSEYLNLPDRKIALEKNLKQYNNEYKKERRLC